MIIFILEYWWIDKRREEGGGRREEGDGRREVGGSRKESLAVPFYTLPHSLILQLSLFL